MNDVIVLKEIYKGAKMGMDSISQVTEKVKDNNFRQDLIYQYTQYRDITNNSSDMLEKMEEFPEDNSMGQKFMGWSGIELNTIANKSNSQISNLLIQGTTMGVIKGVELLHQHTEIEKPTQDLLNTFINMQENNIERLKAYL